MISAVDPDARHAHKTVHRRTDGFNAHVAVEPDTGLITGCELTAAAGADTTDAAVGMALLAADDSITGPVQVLGDSAYGTGDALAALDRRRTHAGDQAVAAAPGRARRVHHRRLHRRRGRRHRDLPARDHPADHPQPDGHLRRRPAAAARCGPAAPPPAAGASLHLHATTRCSAPTGPAPPTRPSRPSTAGTDRWSNARIAWLTRGNRRVRYRGVTKNDAWLHLRAAALNLRRLLNLGLTGTDGHWALAS